MTEGGERIAVRGLLIILTLLVVALILQAIGVFVLLAHDDITTGDIEAIVGLSSLAMVAMAIVGIISYYVRHKEEDSNE